MQMPEIALIENKLEIALVTYNRCVFLDSTLAQLSTSPFRAVKITIFDNHSQDDTPEVCRRYREFFPNLNIVRRSKNIGGGPNYLRAIEAATALYTWVICDDDDYDFSDCADVLQAINEESCDLVLVSEEHMGTWERGLRTTTSELMSMGTRYYPALSFIPSVIFRTELFDGKCLSEGYRHVENSYPQFPFIHESVLGNFSIYVARNPIIIRGTFCSTGLTPFAQYAHWVKCCRFISDCNTRARAINDLTVQGGGFYLNLLKVVAFDTISPCVKRKTFWKTVVLINLAYTMKQRLLFILLLLPVLLTPKAVLHLIRRLQYACSKYLTADTAEIGQTGTVHRIRFAYRCFKTMHSLDFDPRDAFNE